MRRKKSTKFAKRRRSELKDSTYSITMKRRRKNTERKIYKEEEIN